jgi:hypothetical protein
VTDEGFKQSGIGREYGTFGLNALLSVAAAGLVGHLGIILAPSGCS